MKEKDDSDWNNYTIEYLYQIINSYRKGENSFFVADDEIYKTNKGVDFGRELHPNSKEIYNVAYELQPNFILEVGCGGCYHLKLLSQLLPLADIYGCDISQRQIDFGKWFSQLPEKVERNLFVINMAQTTPNRQFDFVFTNAVVMHQSTKNAVAMLSNIKKISTKHVLLIESPDYHENWLKMVQDVFFNDWYMRFPNKYIQHAILLTKNE